MIDLNYAPAPPMDPSEIYAKTELGLAELRDRKLNLPITLRGLLILIDGNRTVAQVLVKARALKLDERAMTALERGGLIAKRFSAPSVAQNDETMTREALRVAGIPCRLHVVEDGMNAISFLCQTRQFNDAPRPDIVVLDLNIPKINGHEVLNEIKSNDRLKHIPVVVLTCSKSAGDMRKSYRMNADRFMTKAMGMDTYVEQIKSIAALAAH